MYGEVFRTSVRDVLGTLVGVTYRAMWERLPDVGRRRPRDVGRGRPLALHIGPYGDVPWTLHFHVLGTSVRDVLRTSVRYVLGTLTGDVLRTLAGDIPWRYIEDHMGTSTGRLSGMFSGHNFAEWDIFLK